MDEFVEQVRYACKHYGNEDNRIGKLAVAGVALQAALINNPHHAIDLGGRATALRKAIEAGLMALKPDALFNNTLADEVYRSLYCTIYKKDPTTHQTLSNVATYLSSRAEKGQITRSIYFQRLKTGYKNLAHHISLQLAQQTTYLEVLPTTQTFIGRDLELTYYQTCLKKQNMAVIQGIGGVGKTTLGAELCKQQQKPVCWLTIRAELNSSLMGLLYAWASFLAQQGYPTLWATLRTAKGQNITITDYLPRLKQGLTKIKPLLCLDNLEAVTNVETTLRPLLDIAYKIKGVQLLLISRQRPNLPWLDSYKILKGLSSTEIANFLTYKKIKINTTQAEQIKTYTHGNPRLLKLWLAQIKLKTQKTSPLNITQSLTKLSNTAAVEHYLSTEILQTLKKEERKAMLLIALTRQPLDSYLLQHPPKTLSLADLNLKTKHFKTLIALDLIEISMAEQWTLSPLLSEYLTKPSNIKKLQTLGLNEKHLLWTHQWLSRWYLHQKKEVEAAYHAIKGNEAEWGILLLAEQKKVLIEQGQAMAMQAILINIKAESLSHPGRQVWRSLKGELWQLLGNYTAAESEARLAGQEARNILEQANSERRRGTLKKNQGHFWQAENHYKQALHLLANEHLFDTVWLHRNLAWVYQEQDNLEAAEFEANRAQIALYNVQGFIAMRQGDYKEAENYFELAYQLAETVGSDAERLRVLVNTGVCYLNQGKYHKAIAKHIKSGQLAQKLDNVRQQAISLLNCGTCYFLIKNYAKAIEVEKEALEIFNTLGELKGALLSHAALAEAYLANNNLSAAHNHAKAALAIKQTEVSQADYAEALRVYAEVLHKQGHHQAALTTAHQALALLQLTPGSTLDCFIEPYGAGWVCITLSRIYTSLQKFNEFKKYVALAKALGVTAT